MAMSTGSSLFERQIRKFLVHTIDEVRRPSYEADGVDHPDTIATNVPCRFEPNQRLIRADDGREVLLQGNVYVGPDVNVYPDVLLKIGEQEYTVFRVVDSVDGQGSTVLRRLEVR